MNNVFNQKVIRPEGVCWLKDMFTPDTVKEAGLLGYSGAEFEFPTCPALSKGVARLLERGVFGYTLPKGSYLERVIWWMDQVRDYQIKPEWIIPTHGTIFSLATIIRMTTRPGERIIVPVPGYNRYEQAAARLGRGTVRIPLLHHNGVYGIDWQALEKAMAAPENRLLVLCNPNNPTGNIYTEQELALIASLSRKYQVLVFSDEIFADVTFGGRKVTAYTQAAGPDALAVTCTSLGKTFSLTGVNHANVIIENAALRERFISQRDADHYGSVDPFLFAALTAVYTPEGKAWLEELRSYVWGNYELLSTFLQTYLPQAVLTEPEGTFVAWVDYAKTGLSPSGLHQLLVQEGLFAGDEGEEYFGADTCFRYSLAVPREELKKSLARLKEVLLARRMEKYPQFQRADDGNEFSDTL